MAQESSNYIIVTARRVEERLQDVPLSITVFNQQQLTTRNMVSAGDIATYTPSLSSNGRFGSENTSFAIRGFVQDNGTAPSVAVYFADVADLTSNLENYFIGTFIDSDTSGFLPQVFNCAPGTQLTAQIQATTNAGCAQIHLYFHPS